MAAAFLRTHGVDLEAELDRIQKGDDSNDQNTAMLDIPDRHQVLISDVCLPGPASEGTWDITLDGDKIAQVVPHDPKRAQGKPTTHIKGGSALLAPSLCHPHVHLDKAYLLSHPLYSHLQIEKGDFQEAMELTGKAKADFTTDDLLERGQRVIDESVAAGVTHMRSFVEVDAGVGSKCLEAGVTLKKRAAIDSKCHVQLCAFAQLPLFSSTKDDENGSIIRALLEKVGSLEDVEVVGSTPYVETDEEKTNRNIAWMVDLAIASHKHLDFHLDYNLDPQSESTIWHVIRVLKEKQWCERTNGKTVVLGHCTRLTLFGDAEWQRLRMEVGDLPISFVGLPNSDLFMMRTPERTRGTLDVPRMIKEYGFNACIGMNNIGNAFTPQGSCDPLTLACNGVGVYQSGTQKDTELLYECISTRARQAIGFGRQDRDAQGEPRVDLKLRQGDDADLLLFPHDRLQSWKTRRTVNEAVCLYDGSNARTAWWKGRATRSEALRHGNAVDIDAN